MNETRQLAEWIAAHRFEQLPDAIVHEAKRALLNYLAATFGGCRHEAVDIAVRTVLSLAGPTVASLLGRSQKWALGLAATQSAGVRETFGSMAKAMHPGRAGQNGYFSALLAENGFTSGEHGQARRARGGQ